MAVVGASGVVFGLAGATLADMAANFETLRRPLLRTALLLAFLIFFAVTVGAWGREGMCGVHGAVPERPACTKAAQHHPPITARQATRPPAPRT